MSTNHPSLIPLSDLMRVILFLMLSTKHPHLSPGPRCSVVWVLSNMFQLYHNYSHWQARMFTSTSKFIHLIKNKAPRTMVHHWKRTKDKTCRKIIHDGHREENEVLMWNEMSIQMSRKVQQWSRQTLFENNWRNGDKTRQRKFGTLYSVPKTRLRKHPAKLCISRIWGTGVWILKCPKKEGNCIPLSHFPIATIKVYTSPWSQFSVATIRIKYLFFHF